MIKQDRILEELLSHELKLRLFDDYCHDAKGQSGPNYSISPPRT